MPNSIIENTTMNSCSMKILIQVFLVAIMLFSVNIFSGLAQNGPRSYNAGTPAAKVSGTVVDNSNGQPVGYAVVAIYRAKDSTLVSGGTSNMDGNFSIEGLPYGKFYGKISFVGYNNQFVSNIVLTPNQKAVALGTIKIVPSTTNIKEVVVTGNKSAIEYKIDKKVVDVSQNVAAAGGTLVDALQNTPSVQTDVEGNVTLRGSSNFTVLIDGKPSPLSGSEALQQIPANLVQNVEIITNPSAKFEAEGSAGIMNIIMKKQKIRGMNGVVNVTAGTGGRYRGSINTNYRISKFNFTLGADLSDMYFKMNSFSNNQYTMGKDSIRNQTSNGNGKYERKGNGITAGLDYYINDNNTLSITGGVGNRRGNRSFSNRFLDDYTYLIPENIINYQSNSSTATKRNYFNVNLDYLLKLGDNGHQLSASAYFTKGPDNDYTSLTQDTTDAYGTILNKGSFNTKQEENETDLRTKIDYSLPVGEKGRFEAGYQGRYYKGTGSYSIYDNGIEDLSQTDNLTFHDQIQAGYLSFNNSMSLFDYQLGLRTEYENREIKQDKASNPTLNRIDFFPSIHLTRQLPWDLQIQASYTRRINRPREWYLNPFPMKTSLQDIREGNPNLKPEFTNSFELNLEKKIDDASFVSVEGFLRQTQNHINSLNLYNSTTNINTTTFENIDHDRSTGVELMLNLVPLKWLTFNISSDIYQYALYLGDSIKKTNTWNIHINPAIKLPTGTSLQFNYTYNAKSISVQGSTSGFYTTSFGIKQDLLNRKANLTIMVQNFIGDPKMSSSTYTSNKTSYSWTKRETWVVMATFSYRINSYKVQPNKQKQQEDMNSGGMDDMGGM
jgi:outer membrane receptor protein involved in Fe transport